MSQETKDKGNDEQTCAICLAELMIEGKPIVTLPCHPIHAFHKDCIIFLFVKHKGGFIEDQPLIPKCPYCDVEFDVKNVPGFDYEKEKRRIRYKEARDLKEIEKHKEDALRRRLINEPSYIMQPSSQRPMRLKRQHVIYHKKRVEEALQELMIQRQKLLTNKTIDTQNTAKKRGRCYMESDSSQSTIASQSLISSQVSQSTHAGESNSFQPNPSADEQLRQLNMRIYVANQQLQQSGANSPINQDNFPPPEDSNDVMLEDEFEPIDLRPLYIYKHEKGRGKNIYYWIKWSDETTTLNKWSEISEKEPKILENWKKTRGAQRTRECRERKRIRP